MQGNDVGYINSSGVLYVVLDNIRFIKECVYSAKSFKKHCPDIKVQLITNIGKDNFENSPFDFIDITDKKINPYKGKVFHMMQSRFDRTLYIDADTKFIQPVYELFHLLNNYDIAFAYENDCNWETFELLNLESNTVNTGMILFKRGEKLMEYFRIWFENLNKQDESVMRPGHFADQAYFNNFIAQDILSHRGVKCVVLPNNIYNVRSWSWPLLKKNNVFHHVKVLHAHDLNWSISKKIIVRLNRIFNFNNGKI